MGMQLLLSELGVYHVKLTKSLALATLSTMVYKNHHHPKFYLQQRRSRKRFSLTFEALMLDFSIGGLWL